VKIERRRIALDEPIKALGDTTVGVRIHPEVVAQLKVTVVREE
jgi:large subunit ribosomal protein L9